MGRDGLSPEMCVREKSQEQNRHELSLRGSELQTAEAEKFQ